LSFELELIDTLDDDLTLELELEILSLSFASELTGLELLELVLELLDLTILDDELVDTEA
jgi:hypothetical protein